MNNTYDFCGTTIYNILGKAYVNDGNQYIRISDDSPLMDQLLEDCDYLDWMDS